MSQFKRLVKGTEKTSSNLIDLSDVDLNTEPPLSTDPKVLCARDKNCVLEEEEEEDHNNNSSKEDDEVPLVVGMDMATTRSEIAIYREGQFRSRAEYQLVDIYPKCCTFFGGKGQSGCGASCHQYVPRRNFSTKTLLSN